MAPAGIARLFPREAARLIAARPRCRTV